MGCALVERRSAGHPLRNPEDGPRLRGKGTFVNGIPGDSDDVAITQAVIAMAHSLGLGVIAEGVEVQAQLDALREMGCDEVQGYLLGRPMPAAQLALRLRESACDARNGTLR